MEEYTVRCPKCGKEQQMKTGNSTCYCRYCWNEIGEEIDMEENMEGYTVKCPKCGKEQQMAAGDSTCYCKYCWNKMERKLDMEKELSDELKELEITAMNERAENAVAVAVAATAATGAIPIPFADAPAMIAGQVALMVTICGIYGIDVSKDGLKMLATTAIGAGGAAVVGKTVASNLLKLIPGAGTVAGAAISAGTAGVITLAMGKAFIEVCKMVKLGKLSVVEMTSSRGADIMKDQFKVQMKNNK